MPVRELDSRPEAYSHFEVEDRYRWLELYDGGEVYGYCAIAERSEALELHLSLTSWGARVRRSLRGDVEWLKSEARRLGKMRIMGIRADNKGEFDDRLFKFARLFGFTDMCVFQTACLNV